MEHSGYLQRLEEKIETMEDPGAWLEQTYEKYRMWRDAGLKHPESSSLPNKMLTGAKTLAMDTLAADETALAKQLAEEAQLTDDKLSGEKDGLAKQLDEEKPEAKRKSRAKIKQPSNAELMEKLEKKTHYRPRLVPP
jgi:hypothetical protein